MSGKLNKAQDDTLQSLQTAINTLAPLGWDTITLTEDGDGNITTVTFDLSSTPVRTYTVNYTSGIVTSVTKA